jgi:hypothetical protein
MQKPQRLRCGRTVQLQSGAHEFWLCAPLAAEMGRHWQPHRTFIKTETPPTRPLPRNMLR